jgi:hypothetical protein
LARNDEVFGLTGTVADNSRWLLRSSRTDAMTGDKVKHPLDALNFFLADVRDGLGPYLAIYLLTEQKWDQASIGVVMSIAALAGIIAQTPAGALIDKTTAKRGLIVAAAVMVTIGSVVLPLFPGFFLVATTQALTHVAAAVFAPALAPSRLASSDRRRLPQLSPAYRLIFLGRSSCSGYWPQWPSPAFLRRCRFPPMPSTIMSRAGSMAPQSPAKIIATSQPDSRCC